MSETNVVKDESGVAQRSELQPVVMCVGVDNKQHAFTPHEQLTTCGSKIKRKKQLRDDWKLFSCYECTF